MPEPLFSSQPLALGVLRWSERSGRSQLTVIAKATFELRASGLAQLRAAPEPLHEDVWQPGAREPSLLAASDFIPYKPRADVLVVGRAHGPRGRPVKRFVVGVALAHGADVLLAKQLVVPGAGTSAQEGPRPLQELGPLGPDSEPRARRLRPEDKQALRSEPLVLPADFDLSFYNCAPSDQQLPFLRGGEQILLKGMHPLEPEIRCRLPALCAHASVRVPGKAPEIIVLQADTLFIDADRMLACVSWRGQLALTGHFHDEAGHPDISVGLAPIPEVEEILADPPEWRGRPSLADAERVRAATPLARDRGTPELVNLSPLEATSFEWCFEPDEPRSVLVVKGTFALRARDRAELSSEQAPLSGDRHYDDEPNASLCQPSDFAPFKPKTDVLLVGQAYAGSDGKLGLVTLKVGSEVDKRIVAIGARRWLSATRMSEPATFVSLPLRYELAYGGPSFSANPAGIGADKDDDRLPSFEWPDRLIRQRGEAARPAGVGALAPSWAPRAGGPGSYDGSWLRERWPFLPADFDWAVYNCAPGDQQCSFLQGDERYALAGVRPEGSLLEGTLPGMRPRAFAWRAAVDSGAEELSEIALRLDTALFDAETEQVQLVWRGACVVSDRQGARLERILLLADAPGVTTTLEEAWLGMEAAIDPRFRGHAKPFGAVGARPPADQALPAVSVTALCALLASQDSRAALAASLGRGAATLALAPIPPASPPSRAAIERALAEGESLAGRDLSGSDLSGLDLHGADLRGAVLKDATLREAKLDGARCEGLCLADADARGSSWVGADLSRADAAGAALQGADLSGALLPQTSFERADLERATLRGATGPGASFVRARLLAACLEEAELSKADFSGAELDQASFRAAKLDDAKAYEAVGAQVVLDDASLVDARFEKARLGGLSARRIKAAGSSWEGASLGGAALQDAELRGAGLVGAQLAEANLDGADAREGRFGRAVLQGASLRRANLMQASFEQADLRRADLSGANLYQAETWKAELDGVRLDGALVAGSKLASPTRSP